MTTSATVLAPCEVCGRDVAATSLRDYIVAQGTVLKACPTCHGQLTGKRKKTRPQGA